MTPRTPSPLALLAGGLTILALLYALALLPAAAVLLLTAQ